MSPCIFNVFVYIFSIQVFTSANSYTIPGSYYPSVGLTPLQPSLYNPQLPNQGFYPNANAPSGIYPLSQIYPQSFPLPQYPSVPTTSYPSYGQPGTSYPQQKPVYPQQKPVYPQPEISYPQPEISYPQPEISYPQQSPVYPQPETSYPQQFPETSYPQQYPEISHPQQSPVYPHLPPSYPAYPPLATYPPYAPAYPFPSSGLGDLGLHPSLNSNYRIFPQPGGTNLYPSAVPALTRTVQTPYGEIPVEIIDIGGPNDNNYPEGNPRRDQLPKIQVKVLNKKKPVDKDDDEDTSTESVNDV